MIKSITDILLSKKSNKRDETRNKTLYFYNQNKINEYLMIDNYNNSERKNYNKEAIKYFNIEIIDNNYIHFINNNKNLMI